MKLKFIIITLLASFIIFAGFLYRNKESTFSHKKSPVSKPNNKPLDDSRQKDLSKKIAGYPIKTASKPKTASTDLNIFLKSIAGSLLGNINAIKKVLILAESDLDQAILHAKQQPSQMLQNEMLALIFSRLISSQPEKVMQLLANSDPKIQELRSSALSYWISQEQKIKDSSLSPILRGLVKNKIVSHSLKVWGYQDPKVILGLANAMDQSKIPKAMEGLFWRWSMNNPDEASPYISKMAASVLKNNVVANHVSVLFESQGLAKAKEFVDQLPPSSAKDWAFKHLSISWSRNNPQEFANFAVSLPEGQIKREVFSWTGMFWAKQNAAEAKAYTYSIPPGGARDSYVEALAKAWSDFDPVAAASYLDEISISMKADQPYHSAVYGVAYDWVKKNPEAALNWVRNLKDNNTRQRQTYNTLQNWLAIDREAAQVWIQRSNLSNQMKQKLLKQS